MSLPPGRPKAGSLPPGGTARSAKGALMSLPPGRPKAGSLIDPITLEIAFNGLRSITDETFIALMRSAYSTNIKERRDHSTAIVDRRGRLVVQAEASLPIHIASMVGMMEAVLRKFGDDIHEGDIFIANDPHTAGGTHLPDVNMATPLLAEGRVVAFVCNIAHHADIGGMAPGSMASGMSEIYQEGIRLPPIRLFRRGELQQDLLDLLLLNMRIPRERRGDYFAQVAACRLGARRLGELLARYGVATLESVFDDIIVRTAKRMRAALAQIPAGVYRFEDMMDDDGLGTFDIPLKLKVEVGDGRIRFDFTGSSAQVKGNINVTLNATQASVCYALKALLDPDVPNNQGVLDTPEIIAPHGTILNAAFPAAVAARANTCQRIIDLVIGALAPALPEQAVGAANGANTTAVFSGVDPRNGRDYVYLETLGGGFGGRATKDGKDGVQVHITNTSNLPVEAIETEFPLMVLGYGLIEDSGGAGTHRGGLGLRRVISPLGHECIFSGVGERFRHAPWGLFGATAGASGRFVLTKASSGDTVQLAAKSAAVTISAGDVLTLETPGAGGYGEPGLRSETDVAEDRRTQKFSERYLLTHYRVGR